MHGAWRKTTAVICSLLIALSPLLALAAEPKAASIVQQSGSRSGTVRVFLSSLGNVASLNLTLAGGHKVDGSSTTYAGGTKLLVSFSNGKIYVTANGGNKQDMGTSFTLRRTSGGTGSGVKIAEAREPGNIYTGDMSFVVRSGRMYPVAHIFIEDYLYGVLPYEMSNTWPLEALKAQAVAARTYTLKAMNNKGSLYDVVDTTNDQVYRGMPTSAARCVQAVDATAGMVGLYNGNVMSANYAASNGGQTDSAKNVWGSTSAPYMDVHDDPYDLANANSIVKRANITSNGSSPAALATLLKTKLSAKMPGLGYRSGADTIQISSITSIIPHTPKYASPSRLYTKLDFNMRVTAVRNDTGVSQQVPGDVVVTLDYFSEVESLLGLGIQSSNNELIDVTTNGSGFVLSARRYGHGIGMSQRGAQEMANQGYAMAQIIGFYYSGVSIAQYTFTRDTLAAAEGTQAAGEDVAVDASKATAQVTLANPLETLNLRDGPGTYAGILGKIPHGYTLKVLAMDSTGTWYKVEYGSLTGYVMGSYLTFTGDTGATPTPTETPGPSATPDLTQGLSAQVSLSSVQSKLNLRAGPGTNNMVLLRLSHGAALRVIGRTGTWLKVLYGASEGFVSQSYVTILEQGDIPELNSDGSSKDAGEASEDPDATPSPTATPVPGEGQPGSATVNVATGQTLNLREQANTSADVVTRLPSGAQLVLLSSAADWSQVRYGVLEGYVLTTFLSITQMPEGLTAPEGGTTGATTRPTTNPSDAEQGLQKAIVKLRYSTSRLNIRQNPNSTATVIGTVAHGARLEIYSQTGSWTEILYGGQRGYVASGYLESVSGNTNAASATATPVIPSGAPQGKVWEQIIINVDSSLNLRSKPSTDADIIGSIPGGTQIAAISEDASWYYVHWQNNAGYVSKQYVKAADSTTQATASGNILGTQNTPGLTVLPTPTPKPSDPTPAQIINAGKVNDEQEAATVYGTPDEKGTTVTTLARGTAVNLLSYAGDEAEWCEIYTDSARGYVKRAALTLDKKVALVVLKSASSTLSLRSGPSTEDAVTDQVRMGGVTVLSQENAEWTYVQVAGGNKGYLFTEYLWIP